MTENPSPDMGMCHVRCCQEWLQSKKETVLALYSSVTLQPLFFSFRFTRSAKMWVHFPSRSTKLSNTELVCILDSLSVLLTFLLLHANALPSSLNLLPIFSRRILLICFASVSVFMDKFLKSRLANIKNLFTKENTELKCFILKACIVVLETGLPRDLWQIC